MKKVLKFEAEGQELANFLKSLEQLIQTEKDRNNFLLIECFWFLITNKLEQSKFKLEENIGI